MSRRPCVFYGTPQGCRRGNDCRFLHPAAEVTLSLASPPHGHSSPVRTRGSPSFSAASPAKAPPGICNSYWTTGSCNREFACRFRHETASTPYETDSNRSRLAGVGPSSRSEAIDAIAPFLTGDGLARVLGTGTDIFFSPDPSKDLSPTEAHNAIKRFLFDDYRFTKTFDIYSFLKPLSSAHSTNKSWTSEEGQLLLSTCSASSNGLLRVNDILKWPLVSTRAGSSPVTLSFQRGYLPLLRYLSSEFVVKSTLGHFVNALYLRIMDNIEHFATILETCMTAIMAVKSFKDPQFPASKDTFGSQVLASLVVVFFECLTRFKNATITHPNLTSLIRNLRVWVITWVEGVSASPPLFDDPFGAATKAARDHITGHLINKVDRLVAIIDREQAKTDRALQSEHNTFSSAKTPTSNEGIISALEAGYSGPGICRPDGPRHDNDHLDITEIRIAPTHEELICRISPFLPANLHNAPHPLPSESMERLLDIQFRLLREELIAPLRTSVQLVRDDLLHLPQEKTRLSDLISKGGGKYRGYADGQESVMFNVYSDVHFTPFSPDWRGISVGVTFDTPPGRARSAQPKARKAFWESMASKRLMSGGLVALVWRSGSEVTVHLGILASSTRDLIESAKQGSDRVAVRVSFFDPQVELRILQTLKHAKNDNSVRVLVEAPVMYEAVRPFLEALRVEPESLPFKPYLVHHQRGFLKTLPMDPPEYATVPGFSFRISSLFLDQEAAQNLRLHVTDPNSVAQARQNLRANSRLDPSQADAIVDTLTRRISMIQGPPGTGKSFTGVEILRVLLDNKVGPVLMLAFTNHALDHMLCSVLDTGMTTKVVRLGSRSADERVSQFSIENLEIVHGKSRLDRNFGQHHRALKDVQEEVRKLMEDFQKSAVESSKIMQYIEMRHPEHHEYLINPPLWISTVKAINFDDSEGQWKQIGKKYREADDDKSLYSYWKSGRDLEFVDALGRPNLSLSDEVGININHATNAGYNKFSALADLDKQASHSGRKDSVEDSEIGSDNSENESVLGIEEKWETEPLSKVLDNFHTNAAIKGAAINLATDPPLTSYNSSSHILPADLKDPAEFFFAHGSDNVPTVPTSNRALDELLELGGIWDMSWVERRRLDVYWMDMVRANLHETQLAEFERLRNKHTEKLRTYQEGKDETRRQLLQNVDIIGCTTTGAAKLTSLLKGVAPRVILVEEAGQVLEAHVLGSLVPSTQHLILIGDPLQLRPTLNNYSLSMDSRRGSQLFKFDMSLMERLASSGMRMSQIDVQRRMRPEISSLIRNTLYPKLEDHDLVKEYPHVRGFAKDVFFFSHHHAENGGVDESASKYNQFEVEIIKDLVMYLLRQGIYSQEGDIVILCAYLGQLAHVRDALADEIAVVIDERDQMALADHEDEKDISTELTGGVERVRVAQRVRLRTVDNFQGEEAKIIILSLVRNSGISDDPDGNSGASGGRVNIGFLKSENRTNVALSRAREGLFILGNASNLASQSPMWDSIINELAERDAVGCAFPIACHRHPDSINYVSEPGGLPQIAPDGGCMMPCDSRLTCGHLCPFKCHPDDPNHISVTCVHPCRRLCLRDHPCSKQCAEPCGDCHFPIANIELPCGHRQANVPCYMMDHLSEVFCDVIVTKALPNCEHTVELMCSVDASRHLCLAPCGGIMTSCCGRDCKSRCFECQQENTAEGARRIFHRQHPCQKTLFCEHNCQSPCSQGHKCTTKCKETCRQVCPHAKCRKPCSSPCAPCQEACTWNCPHHSCPVPCGSICARLPCDRRCERVLHCGHNCPSVCGEDCMIQVCPQCSSLDVRKNVVDLVMGRALDEINLEEDVLGEIIITLPNCLHIFTVETLDGVCDMADFYERDGLEGCWLKLKNPPLGFRKPPMCPTCRAAITSPRYSRIFKRADLDILENNIASQMSHSLQQVHQTLETPSTSTIKTLVITEAARTKAQSTVMSPKETAMFKKARAHLLKERREVPLAPDALDLSNEKLYMIAPSVAQAWRTAIKELLYAYTQAQQIAETRSAHVHAWQAAFSFLYEQEMEESLADPLRAPRKPEEHAMRVARIKVGQPPPRADKRFLVEAFWMTLSIRFTLSDLAQTWLENISKDDEVYSSQQRQAWATSISFILHSCSQDAKIARQIAVDSGSQRQAVKTLLYIMRAELELFRFNLDMTQRNSQMKDNREELILVASEKQTAAAHISLSTTTEYQTARGCGEEEQLWLEENFNQTARTIIEEWLKIERTLRRDTFYEPVSLEERMSIVRAFNFSHTGHYYHCPNGHLFVITECGGANQRAFCPECGEAIGGENHTLNQTNSHAADFETLALQVGAQQSPFAWGRL